MPEDEIRPGRYRHFKGNVYIVLGIARHSETMEKLVIYRDESDSAKVWARPAGMWNETVVRDGRVFRRFEYLDE